MCVFYHTVNSDDNENCLSLLCTVKYTFNEERVQTANVGLLLLIFFSFVKSSPIQKIPVSFASLIVWEKDILNMFFNGCYTRENLLLFTPIPT